MIFIRGIAVANDVERILKQFGKQNYIRVVKMLNAEDQELFLNKIIAADLYPLDSFVRFVEAEIQLLYNGDRTRIIHNSEDIFKRQLQGVFRWFIQFGTPSYVIGEIVKITQAYFEGVSMKPVIMGNGRFLGQILGFEKKHEILQYAIIAFFKKALETSGAKNVQAKFTVPFSTEKQYSEILVTWGVEIIL
jgi:hypothetical protein